MTTPSVPICEACIRLTARTDGELGYACAAFPDGIPDEIYPGGFDHREPFPGDHGVRFELDPAETATLAVYEQNSS